MIIECKHCNQKVDVPLYFFNGQITTEDNPSAFTRYYTAMVDAKAICPLCGHEIREIFHHLISMEDIIWIATNGEGIKRR